MKHPADEARDAMEAQQRIAQERRQVSVSGYDPNAPRRGPVSWLFGKLAGLVGLIIILSFLAVGVALATGNADALGGVLEFLPWNLP